MACICLGPKGAGKTHLLKALQEPDAVDETTYSTPTLGTSIYNIRFPSKAIGTTNDAPLPPKPETEKPKHLRNLPKSIQILEIGGVMAPLWRKYFENVHKLIYVVDTSNLCQISAAGEWQIQIV